METCGASLTGRDRKCLPRSTACRQMRSVSSLAREDKMALRDISTAPIRTVFRHPRRPTTAFITTKPVDTWWVYCFKNKDEA